MSISLTAIESQLTAELQRRFDDTLARASKLLAQSLSIHSFHAIIGCRNNDFVDVVRTQFSDPDDFWRRWLRGFRIRLLEDQRKEIERYGRIKTDKSVFRLQKLIKDDSILEYTRLFLVRNFYRNLKARTRAKPKEALWEVWFGENRGPWGLLLTPAHRSGVWTNDKSEMRHAKYEYWTVGHVVHEGLTAPHEASPYKFSTPNDLIQFYSMVLMRSSRSSHERNLGERYVAYLKASDDVNSEPFLIPEMRFAGLEVEHKHRLDYALLNPHTMQFIGFELSPHSTHGKVAGITKKTQTTINKELSLRWEEEMAKRNDYFKAFGITTVTFTDSQLADPDSLFDIVRGFLAARPEDLINADEELLEIRSL